VNEHVLTTVIRLDEAKTFLAVEPLYGSYRHETLLSVRVKLAAQARSRLR
jgi:hypothetical protein